MKIRKIVAVALSAVVAAGCAMYSAPTAEMLRGLRVHAATVEDLTFRIVSIASGEAPTFTVDKIAATTAGTNATRGTGTTTKPYQYAVLTGCDPYASGTLEIPSQYEGLPVLEIAASAFDNRCYDLEKVVVPDSVVSIRRLAFANCEKLKEVVLPKNLLGVSDSMFSGCTSLAQVILPDSITVIGSYAFYKCASLKSISIPDSVTVLGSSGHVFYECTRLESVKLPSQIREIPPYTFYHCSALKDVIIPEGISRIEQDAFFNCSSLESISLPASVTTVREFAFYRCESLTSISFLNPECMISDGIIYSYSYSSEIPTFYGIQGSTAETYANEHNYTFKPLEDAPQPQIPENTLPKAPEGAVYGDVTGDGNVTIEDAQSVLKFYVESFAGNKPTWYSVTGNPDSPV